MIYAFKWTVLIHYANDYHLIRCAGISNIIGCLQRDAFGIAARNYGRKMLILEDGLQKLNSLGLLSSFNYVVLAVGHETGRTKILFKSNTFYRK